MKVPIVNEADEIIGYKDRSELAFQYDIFRTASLWITNSKNEILLAQRKFDKKVDPGKWAEAVGGTVENNDTYEATVLREAEEELGLKLTNEQITLGPKQFITSPARYFVQWYTIMLDRNIEGFQIQTEEVEQIAWIPVTQLKKELQIQPEKYIDSLPGIVNQFQ